MSHSTMIKPADVPAPDTMIDYGNGHVGALMFHFAVEGQSYKDIATEAGFEIRFLALENDDVSEEVSRAYETGDDGVCAIWDPVPPAGWHLGAKSYTEDGPYAAFIRPISEADDLGACLGCGKRMHAGDHYYPDVSGGMMCATCAPTYQEMIDAPDGFVDLETEEPSKPEDLRAQFDAHIAAGGKPTDSMATEVLE